jgi:hypothetical protein
MQHQPTLSLKAHPDQDGMLCNIFAPILKATEPFHRQLEEAESQMAKLGLLINSATVQQNTEADQERRGTSGSS